MSLSRTSRIRFKRLLIFSVLFALVVIFLGAYTRLTDAGLGCPDWPGCYGHLQVPESEALINKDKFTRPLEPHKAWAEMIHRYVAGTLGLLILWIAVWVTVSRNTLAQGKSLPYVLVLLVIFQAALGMWTVTKLLSPAIVTAHLLGGFATLSLLWWLFLNQQHQFNEAEPQANKLKPVATLALILLIFQIILGGWTSTNYAAVACGVDFPKCAGEWWPNMDFTSGFTVAHQEGVDYEFGVLENEARKAIQVTHRMGALLVFAFLSFLIIRLRHRYNTPRLKHYGMMIGIVLLLQLTLGILNVVLALPLWIAVLHNIGAVLLLMLLIAVNHHVYRVQRH